MERAKMVVGEIRRDLERRFGAGIRYRAPSERVRPSGWADLDRMLLGGGLPEGGLVGLTGPGSLLFLAEIARRVGPGFLVEIQAWGATGAGVSAAPEALTHIRAADRRMALGAACHMLGCGGYAFGAVLTLSLDRGEARRLQMAGSRGRTPAFVVTEAVSGARQTLVVEASGDLATIRGPGGSLAIPMTQPIHEVRLSLPAELPDRRSAPGDRRGP